MGKLLARNTSRIYYVGYSYVLQGERIRGLFKSCAKTDQDAIEEAKRTLIPAKYKGFNAKVVGFKEY